MKLLPFASITWIRFNGSAALPHSTLSLRASTFETTGWLPCNSRTLDPGAPLVKRGKLTGTNFSLRPPTLRTEARINQKTNRGQNER